MVKMTVDVDCTEMVELPVAFSTLQVACSTLQLPANFPADFTAT